MDFELHNPRNLAKPSIIRSTQVQLDQSKFNLSLKK